MEYKYVIIGGGIAGITAAETIRELDSSGTIAVFTKEAHLLYSRVLLPSFLKGVIRKDQLFLRTFGDFEKSQITIFLKRNVIDIDIKQKKITFQDNESLFHKKNTVFYEKLLIASGGEVEEWPVAGNDKKGIFCLQTIGDAEAIAKYLPQAKKAIVAGGSFIALEFLEIFSLRRIPISLICKSAGFFSNSFDSIGGEIMDSNFRRHGIEPRYKEEVREVLGGNWVSGTRTNRPAEYQGNIIGVGIGLNKNLDFFKERGFLTGEEGIRTNEYLETENKGVFAAGDIAEFYDVIFEKHRAVGNWTNAFLQGEIAGFNMAGRKTVFRNVPSYSITNLGFQITALGEIEAGEGVETISRANPPFHKYERFFIKDGVMKGAFMINMFFDKPIISRWIENKVSVEKIKGNFADISFNLAEVVVE
ncbi:MAG: hypothetical protein A3G49_04145 [Candidatus Sungbacteria bacterium RIFCSPLOWO2_12_FULL_41_11]|uniref:FAD/NAD(P)-binding domain-containing protein n=1 Tax=Candidatus Sungbacteria bacterium RIFCSPLOWO2_12_FULL_41_11 TaxID=1802286 RepID=A0A1G2LVF6_9BACT|nr:MAG: hypothetical protein A3D41_02610 [Candidatus Sungbacteria bacterium RIFCSPHIGHO2_02_FULL_41_12b]OHA14852.1 MAG: hypothetical protein A3G49_04145 [Candidatus Sungbacteria bacterium RIFCSPLOWO2_12_FULL_41_11]